MARKKPGGGRTTPKKAVVAPLSSPSPLDPRAPRPPASDADDQFDDGDLELFRSIRMAIDANPIELLGLASAFVDSTDPRARPIIEATPEDDDEVLEQLLEMAGLEARETDALAITVAALLPSSAALPRVRERIGATAWLPTWLREIDDATVEHAFELFDAADEGDQLALEVRFPGGKTFSILIMIDNEQDVVTDGFAVPIGIEELTEIIDNDLESGISRRPIDLGAARARLEEAIDMGFNVFPAFETDTWPDLRPLTEWVVRLLPEQNEPPGLLANEHGSPSGGQAKREPGNDRPNEANPLS